MSVTIQWPAVPGQIELYELQKASDSADQPSTFAVLTTIQHDLLGAAYSNEKFSYTDATGTRKHWYRLRSKDIFGNWSPYTPAFQPPPVLVFPNQVGVTHDYGSTDALRYIKDGVAVSDAQIRVFKKTDYDKGVLTAALGKTSTTATGRWAHAIHVEAGYTYTVHFLKPGAYGPDTKEITV
ncbi:MAG: hypothetical protein CMK74_00555 [Pseudomonadales bacterium]|nr:hypothetical protein [Pseudomonadales bacterium]